MPKPIRRGACADFVCFDKHFQMQAAKILHWRILRHLARYGAGDGAGLVCRSLSATASGVGGMNHFIAARLQHGMPIRWWACLPAMALTRWRC